MVSSDSWIVLRDTHPQPVSATDSHALAYIVGESVANSVPLETRRQAVMDGLCDLIGAAGWTFLLPGVESIQTTDGVDWDPHSSLSPPTPNGRRLCTSASGTIIVSGKSPVRSDLCTVCIFREPNQPAFSKREQRLALILLEEIPWLYEAASDLPPPDKPGEDKISRKQQILKLLTKGYDRKRIADELKLSPHTVCDYQKTIYREFGVTSQISLMRNHESPTARS